MREQVLFIPYAEYSGHKNKFQTHLYSAVITVTRSRKAGQETTTAQPPSGLGQLLQVLMNCHCPVTPENTHSRNWLSSTRKSGAKAGDGPPPGADHALAQTVLDARTGICKGSSPKKEVSDVRLLWLSLGYS